MQKTRNMTSMKFTELKRQLDRRILKPFHSGNSYGLSPLQIDLLLLLDKGAAPSMSKVANDLDISKPNVTPVVDKLIKSGYVTRFANSADRRIINIKATEKGQQFIKMIHSDMKKYLDSLFANVEEGKLAEFLAGIDTCLSFLQTIE